jgi:hypothetical protein
MFRSSAARWAAGVVLVVGLLALARFKPWERLRGPAAGERAAAPRKQLQVGFLPVT